jgi:hypothetical protein
MCKYVRDLKFHAIASPKTTRYNYPGGGWSYHPLTLYTSGRSVNNVAMRDTRKTYTLTSSNNKAHRFSERDKEE